MALFDSSRGIDSEDYDVLEYIKDKNSAKIAIITKCDSADTDTESVNTVLEKYGIENIIQISANERGEETVNAVKSVVDKLFTDEKIVIGEDAVISSARQYSSLVRARDYLASAADAIRIGLPQDAASSDIELALGAISELDGRRVTEEVVGDIFSRFCVGK
jgi:tRNA modification GTPase